MDLSWALPQWHHSEYCPCVEFMPVQWRCIMPQTAATVTATTITIATTAICHTAPIEVRAPQRLDVHRKS